MTVESKPLVTPKRHLAAPLNRSHLDRAGPWLRLLAGVVLIAVRSRHPTVDIQRFLSLVSQPIGVVRGTISLADARVKSATSVPPEERRG